MIIFDRKYIDCVEMCIEICIDQRVIDFFKKLINVYHTIWEGVSACYQFYSSLDGCLSAVELLSLVLQ